MLKIYNTLIKQKEDFVPMAGNKVNMYTCGVTVYDDCHIGHARSLYIFEVIRRYLKFRGFDVTLTRNITDIDDKIINRAVQSKIDWKQLADKYIAAYYEDMIALGISKADKEPRAAEYIEQIKKYIQVLIDKKHAYVTDSGVYFSVRTFSGYGKLSGQSIDQMLTGTRKVIDETKHDSLDFALWKKAKEGEPFWPSPWGQGRPGWHIECSVMSQECFPHNDNDSAILDIHAGGLDLKFPHHENEITQSEAYSGKQFAKYWMHHGLLAINGQKMSKSLGNFIAIKDVLNKYPADVLKLFFLQAHYASSIDFSWKKMDETKRAYESILILIEKLQPIFGIKHGKCFFPDSNKPILSELINPFTEVMDNDFNMPKGLAVLFDMVHKCNQMLDKTLPKGSKLFDIMETLGCNTALTYAMQAIDKIGDIFCLNFFQEEKSEFLEEDIEKNIFLRYEAKKQKNFTEADNIRKTLEVKGIILEDKKDGTTIWRRKI